MAALSDTTLSQVVTRVAQLSLSGIQILTALFLIVVVSDYLDGWRRRRALGNIPIVDEGSNLSRLLRWNCRAFDAEKEIANAYNEYSQAGKPFAVRVQHDDHAIALPPSSWKEWRGLGHEQLSFLHALSDFADLSLHVDVTNRTPIEAIHSCNKESTLKKFQEFLVVETDKILPLVVTPPDNNEWIELNAMNVILSASSYIATALILGSNLDNASSITTWAMAYNDSIVQSRILRSGYPRILRFLVWHLWPTCRGLRSKLSRLRELLTPEIQRRIDQVRSGKEETADSTAFSLMDALIEATFKTGALSRSDRGMHEDDQVELLFQQVALYHFELAIPTATNVIHMLFEIMKNPGYIRPLREEIMDALKMSGGQWSFDILKHAPKLESFSREAFRLHDISVFVGLRRVMRPLYLKSVDLSLKPGTIIMTPCRAVHHDPENYADPQKFDGFRFYDASSAACTPQVSTTSPTFLTFSHGPGACPARKFATQISRILFIKLLLKYDFQLGHQEMPRYGFIDGAMYSPNPSLMMRVRRRQDIQ